MYTVRENDYEIEIKKSKFISKIYRVNNIEEVAKILLKLKEEYRNATHYCYAYIINENKKCSDDKEPSGTAGIPILQILEKNNLNMVLCVVIRYFGGIKLGASGLLRAYTKAVSELIKKTPLITLINGYQVKLISSYNEQKKLDFILQKYHYEKQYDDNITYIIDIPMDDIDLIQNYNYSIIKEILIENITNE